MAGCRTSSLVLAEHNMSRMRLEGNGARSQDFWNLDEIRKQVLISTLSIAAKHGAVQCSVSGRLSEILRKCQQKRSWHCAVNEKPSCIHLITHKVKGCQSEWFTSRNVFVKTKFVHFR